MRLFFCICFCIASSFCVGQETDTDWWKKTTVYQIYPRSFYDTNADGIGDLKGIIQKLDYIQSLGFETIWISPFTKSPQRDFGYDISDYAQIDNDYGSMNDFDSLVKEVHKRDMKLLFDLVMNHTSDQHPWFLESASSRDNPKADWYIWENGRGKNGTKRPNNWRGMVGDRAWQYHPIRKQFFYHGFLSFQPDLNYNNPAIKQAMFDIVNFWLNKGVDGFRLDIVSAIYEDSTLKNNPPSLHLLPSDSKLTLFFQYEKNNFLQPQSFEFTTELRKEVDKYTSPTRVLVGESHGEPSLIKQFCQSNGKDGLHSVFLFKAISSPFSAKKYGKLLQEFDKVFAPPLMPTLVFGNHDRTRSMTRIKGSVPKAKLKALIQLTARGVPYIYNGEELGMENIYIPIKDGKDAVAIANRKVPQFFANLSKETLNRDECRTPMLWNEKENAGFCDSLAKPWLPISQNYKTKHVAHQQADSFSLWHTYKTLLLLRKQNEVLNAGDFQLTPISRAKNILYYSRTLNGKVATVVINMSKKAKSVRLPKRLSSLAFSTHSNFTEEMLQPYEGRIYME